MGKIKDKMNFEARRFFGDIYIGNDEIDEKKYPIKIITMEGLERHERIIPLLRNSHYIFNSLSLYAQWDYFFDLKKTLYELNPSFNTKNVIILANTMSQEEEAIEIGFDAIFCPHNAFLNEDVYIINKKMKKVYDCILNGRPEVVKRPYLAKLLSEKCKLAVIYGYNFVEEDFWDLSKLKSEMLNDYYIPGSEWEHRLLSNEVVDIYNKSKIGVILSEVEGGCKVSGEYLLCGLPVLSTVSVGGREWWYNENNTVICDGSSHAVVRAYNEIIKKINKGFYNPKKIRKEHIRKQWEFRNVFIDKVGEILDLNKVTISNHEKFFKDRLQIAKNSIYDDAPFRAKDGLIFLQSGLCAHNFPRVVEILREN